MYSRPNFIPSYQRLKPANPYSSLPLDPLLQNLNRHSFFHQNVCRSSFGSAGLWLGHGGCNPTGAPKQHESSAREQELAWLLRYVAPFAIALNATCNSIKICNFYPFTSFLLLPIGLPADHLQASETIPPPLAPLSKPPNANKRSASPAPTPLAAPSFASPSAPTPPSSPPLSSKPAAPSVRAWPPLVLRAQVWVSVPSSEASSQVWHATRASGVSYSHMQSWVLRSRKQQGCSRSWWHS